MSDSRDPDDVGQLLDPRGGPDEPTPEFTPTPEAEELARWVAGFDDGKSVGTSRSERRARVFGRPPDEAFDTASALEAWVELFIEEMLGPSEDGAP